MGENRSVVCGQGWICADYATYGCDWTRCWILAVLSAIDSWVTSSFLAFEEVFEGVIANREVVVRFYGFTENKREVEMDMKEMVAKVKKGEPLYGHSTLTPYAQGMASRNSRYSGLFLHVIPWFNFVNHNQHGVDTAKYYQQAERELEAERTGQKLA